MPLFDLDVGDEEKESVEGVLDSNWLTMGEVTRDFESAFADYVGIKHTLAVSSGTAAMHLAHMALGLGHGDEVICPSLTFVATANAIRYTGATPVFADIQSQDDLNISPADIESKITEQTRAIAVVHYAGFPCDMDSIMEIARTHDLFVIEDAAHAVGGEYVSSRLRAESSKQESEGSRLKMGSKLPGEMVPSRREFHGAGNAESSKPEARQRRTDNGEQTTGNRQQRPDNGRSRKLGTIGDIGCFSFFGNKNMTTAEGGMVVTDRDDLAERMKIARSHGMTSLTWDRYKGHEFSYDVVQMGFNYRIDELRSSLGIAQLKKLDKNNRARRSLWSLYKDKLEGIEEIRVPFAKFDGISSCHIFPVLLSENIERDSLMEYLRGQGIQTSIHYPPVHLFSYYKKLGLSEPDLPLTEYVGRREVTLPLFPTMGAGDVEYVVKAIQGYLANRY